MKRVGWKEAREKTEREGRCRACRRTAGQLARDGLRLETAHLAPRQFDLIDGTGDQRVRVVDADNTVPLCGPATSSGSCHGRFDGGTLDLLPYLSLEEQAACVARLGLMAATSRLIGV